MYLQEDMYQDFRGWHSPPCAPEKQYKYQHVFDQLSASSHLHLSTAELLVSLPHRRWSSAAAATGAHADPDPRMMAIRYLISPVTKKAVSADCPGSVTRAPAAWYHGEMHRIRG